MTPVLSGGLVYEYSQEKSDYGLVTINDDGSVQLRADFDSLQGQYNKLNVTALQGVTAQNTTIVPPKCASGLITTTDFYNNFTIPSIPSGAQDLIDNGIKTSNSGKLVPVTNTKVTLGVKSSSGTAMDLSITVLADDQSNTPTGQTPASSSSSAGTPTSSATPTSTKKSGASNVKVASGALLGVGVLAAVLL